MDKNDVLKELRGQWQTLIQGDGGVCPCCDRWGKIYSRGINKTMAESLKWLIEQSPEMGWIDVPNTAPKKILRSNQLPTLRWWGLVERLPNDSKPKKKHSGMWRVTSKGVDFYKGKIKVPLKVYTYAGEPVRFSIEKGTFEDALRGSFDFTATMEDTLEEHKAAVLEFDLTEKVK